MGMYDVINGEQVKCFPWVSLYENQITYHGGNLKSYNTGDEVPYKKPHYNYGKNFLILDINELKDAYDYENDYDFIIHVIVDGKVQATYYNDISNIDIDFEKNENVISRRGTLLNIKSKDDILNYIAAIRDYRVKYEKINTHCNELFREMSKLMHGLGLLDKDSKEKKERQKKIKEIRNLIDEEKSKNEAEIDFIRYEIKKWYVDTSDIDDLINLGEYMSALTVQYDEKGIEHKRIEDIIKSLINNDTELIDRYNKWQA